MRIKINAHNIAKKLSAISCQLSAFRNLKPKTYHLKPSLHNLQPKKGFTLIELLVTLSLFVVLTTIVLFSQSRFNGSILLTNLAYDIAITIRQAQTFGINVREDIKSNNPFQNPYGVHFDTSNGTQFLVFADANGVNGDKKYDSSSADSLIESYSIKRGNYISDIRVTSSACSPDPDCSVNNLDITFLRPDPDAIFRSNPDKSNISDAKIIISSANGDNRNIFVNSTGQISIGRGM